MGSSQGLTLSLCPGLPPAGPCGVRGGPWTPGPSQDAGGPLPVPRIHLHQPSLPDREAGRTLHAGQPPCWAPSMLLWSALQASACAEPFDWSAWPSAAWACCASEARTAPGTTLLHVIVMTSDPGPDPYSGFTPHPHPHPHPWCGPGRRIKSLPVSLTFCAKCHRVSVLHLWLSPDRATGRGCP